MTVLQIQLNQVEILKFLNSVRKETGDLQDHTVLAYNGDEKTTYVLTRDNQTHDLLKEIYKKEATEISEEEWKQIYAGKGSFELTGNKEIIAQIKS